jgi:vancomycin permeability regulator SanA
MKQLKIFFIPTDLKTWKKIAIILFALTIIDIAFGILYYHKVQIFISNQTINSKADAGVVFFGSYNLLKNEFDNDTKQRLTNAIHLYKSEKIDHIICVGGAMGKKEFIGSKEMRNYLIRNNINSEIIYYDSLSYDTISNWHEAQKIINRNHFENIIIISSPLHIYRIAKIVNKNNTFFSTHAFNNKSISDYFSTYKNIHHEWIALILTALLPEKIYLKLLYWYRS